MTSFKTVLCMIVSVLCVVSGSAAEAPVGSGVFERLPVSLISNSPHQKTGLRLVENQDVLAFAQTTNGRVFFTNAGVFFGVKVPKEAVSDPSTETGAQTGQWVVMKTGIREDYLGKRGVVPRLEGKSSGTYHFFTGPEEHWRKNVPAFQKMVYSNLWDGVSLEFSAQMDGVALDFIVETDADLQAVRLDLGVDSATLLEDGRLRATLAGAEILLASPVIIAEDDGFASEISVRFGIYDGHQVGLSVPSDTNRQKLHIRTKVTWSTFINIPSGSGLESGYGIAVDASGQAYVTGSTPSGDFPTTAGVFSENNNQSHDLFVTKLNSDGSGLVYSTFLGGSNFDRGNGIAVDGSGNAYLTGLTRSNDFPATSGSLIQAYQGSDDAFVCKLSSDGSQLLYSTFLGSTGYESGRGIAVSAEGSVFVTGETSSSGFPTTSGSFEETHAGGGLDAFVCKINSDGSTLEYGGFLGGSSSDIGWGITVDGAGNAYVVGEVWSSNFPTTLGSFETNYNGSGDAFVCKINPSGSALIYSGFQGGSGTDKGYGIAVDENGNAYITGETASSTFPTTMGVFDETYNGAQDIFLTKVNSDGSTLVFSTFYGGSQSDKGFAIALDQTGNAYITGETRSANLPTTSGSFAETMTGFTSSFVAKFNVDGSQLNYAGFLGGSSSEIGKAVAVDSAGNAYVTGETRSTDFPVTPGVFNEVHRGGTDVFITKINDDGQDLGYSGLLGGSSIEVGHAIAVDGEGCAYITGFTDAADFPTTVGSFDPSFNQYLDVFVAKLNKNADALAYATYLGGSDLDAGWAIAVGSDGSAYVAGETRSSDFPVTTGSFDESHNGESDVFVCKLSPDGSELGFGSFFGGSGFECGKGLALDLEGNAYVTGYTSSVDFPVSPGSFDETFNGVQDGFVFKVSADGGTLSYGSFLGDTDYDVGNGIAVDLDGSAFVTGETFSSGFPVVKGSVQEVYSGGGDGFLTELSVDGSALVFSTFMGGSGSDKGNAVALGPDGHAFVTGGTFSSDFPTTSGAFSEVIGGSSDVFVSKIGLDGTAFEYSSFLGGAISDIGYGIAVDAFGFAHVTGETSSVGFPTTPGAFDETYNGSSDVFVSRFNPDGSGLAYSSFLGDSEVDTGQAIALDALGNAFVFGFTTSPLFPVTSGVLDEVMQGSGDIFVTKLCPEPMQPGLITGPAMVCAAEDGVSYSIDPVPGALTYTWQVPGSSVITSGQGTTSIIVDFAVSSGDVSVTADRLCGSGAAQILAVDVVSGPGLPSPIEGPSLVCDTDTDLVYFVDPVFGADTYVWTVPEGAVITDGQGTETITVDAVPNSGTVSVTPENGCGSGESRILNVTAGSFTAVTHPFGSIGQGVNVETLEVLVDSCSPSIQVQWEIISGPNVGFQFPLNQNPVTLDSVLTVTTDFQVTVTDTNQRTLFTDQVRILVSSNTAYQDWNSDGCNNISDLLEFAQDWRAEYPDHDDPDGDGMITVLDLLYINVSDPDPCP